MRKYYLDNIRWITVVLVVFYHVIYMFNGVQPFGVIGPFHKVQYQDAIQYLLYPWFMALLFVVSGMSSRYYLENHTTKEFIKSRTRKLLVPSTIGLLVFQWILGYFNMAISEAFDTIAAEVPSVIKYFIMALSGIGVLWYIQMLWVFSILLVWIKKLEKDKLYHLGAKTMPIVLVLFSAFAYGFAQILNTPMITVYRFGIYGFSFFVGYFIMSHDEVVERLTKWWLPLSVAAVVLGVAYTIIYFGENYATEPCINNVMACSYCWIAILAIFAVMKKWGDKTSTFAGFMTKKSWGLYVFHYLPLAAVSYYLHLYVPNMPATLVYITVAVAAFVGAYLLYEIISRIPIIRWCVLGIKVEKKEK